MAKLADLLSVEDARAQILERFSRLPAETVSLADARGRVLADDVVAPRDVPPFANSSMDGFAVRTEDAAAAVAGTPVRLEIRGHIAAGHAGETIVTPGTCARIMTGAPLPPGADGVVPFEDVTESDGSITLVAPVSQGACVRPRGNDMRAGAHALPAGVDINAPQIALLASLGFGEVRVTRRPLVAILSTGDELATPGSALAPGQIYNSNTPMLTAAVEEAGAAARPINTVGDDPDVLRRAIAGARDTDVLVTTGGASVGDFDYVKDVVGAEGSLQFWRVRVRPGKPLLLGSVGALPVIGLPGNPTSAMVTFEQFVRPALRLMLGAAPYRPHINAVVAERIDNRGGRRTYARVTLQEREGRFYAHLAGSQDSAMLLPLASADGLLEIPEDREELTAGMEARVQVWRLPAR